MDGLISLRQCLGGAGYSAWSGLPGRVLFYAQFCTVEGDNTVMAEQAASHLFGQARKALDGEEVMDKPFNYLKEARSFAA